MDNLQLQIRPPKDIGEIATFQYICQLVGVPKILGSVDHKRTRGLIMVTSNGEVLGGISYVIYPSAHISDIDALAVHPDYQRKGMGNNLILYLNQVLKKEGVVEIRTIPNNRSSEQYFLKQGFTKDDSFYPYLIKSIT